MQPKLDFTDGVVSSLHRECRVDTVFYAVEFSDKWGLAEVGCE